MRLSEVRMGLGVGPRLPVADWGRGVQGQVTPGFHVPPPSPSPLLPHSPSPAHPHIVLTVGAVGY